MYANVKKKRLPPGAADPLKDGGAKAEELVQTIAAEKGAAGLQQWFDKHGLGTEVMSAADAMKKQEAKRQARESFLDESIREQMASESFDDLSDMEAREMLSREEKVEL